MGASIHIYAGFHERVALIPMVSLHVTDVLKATQAGIAKGWSITD